MLKVRDGVTLQLIRAAAKTSSVDSLLENLERLDAFGPDGTTVELGPDFPASENLWYWTASRSDGERWYEGGLLHRDGNWTLHS